ncbi:hypothetical protein RhiirA5_408010 [Rhizophagus irregularis]|uniref:Uncharacterized protein n=1 Tax=Rhizophagus irregularis TaxID=588596 RepID=A0A2I1FLC6_9GLOM|nr:hypothetical protein RhiirA5_408010 [Rhizophagus irregularis]PKC54739.1 hypothetical protein RhiirA1_476763 [Rhizophagus irregularis]PKY35187.1 hypothetical protein RhiirB3_455656 [Rhizophagus irregularis]CAB4485499.1 unnamed protein product [Rhizophagus irregularis]CAB5356632.1 unnamed protein product [Rhizophagus irregularis]
MNRHNKRSNTDKNDLRPNSNTLNIRDAIGSSDLSVKKSQNSNRTLRVRTSRSNTQADLNNKTIKPPTKQLPSAKSNGMRSFKHINKLKS